MARSFEERLATFMRRRAAIDAEILTLLRETMREDILAVAAQNNIEQASATKAIALGIPQAAKASGLGRTSLKAAIKAGTLPAQRYGRKIIIMSDDLAAWLKSLPSRMEQLE